MTKKTKNSFNFKNRMGVLRSTKAGSSLLVAIGLTTIIVLVSLGVTTVVVSSIRDSANITGANLAYYAAEGSLEEGLLTNQEAPGAGYSTASPTGYCTDPLCMTPSSTLKANYILNGQVPSTPKYNTSDASGYGIPTPGTGDVGVNCNELQPVTSGSFYYDSTHNIIYDNSSDIPPNPNPMPTPEDASWHPCNWNKIMVGQTVSIPLYYTCSSNSTNDPNCAGQPAGYPVNIFDQNSTLSLRIRTACDNGSIYCDIGNRPKLQYDSNPTYGGNDPIVSWNITGTDPTGNQQYNLSPVLSYNSQTNLWNLTKTSIIYEGRINGAASTSVTTPFEVLNQTKCGTDSNNNPGSIINFLANQNSTSVNCQNSMWSSQKITKPVLKISVIHSLNETNGEIPYLEYQVVANTPVGKLPTDSSQTITAEGYSGTFKQVLEVKQPQESGLLEYVIQQ